MNKKLLIGAIVTFVVASVMRDWFLLFMSVVLFVTGLVWHNQQIKSEVNNATSKDFEEEERVIEKRV